MSLTLVSRGGWDARPPKAAYATTATETFLHHSASDHRGAAGVRAIQNFHMDGRGWLDIAYNFLIDRRTLVVYEGRGWGVRPGSQKNYNTGTWSVCVMGNFNSAIPSEGLLDTIAELIRHGVELGHLPRTLTGGHRDAPGQNTQCPGANLYPQIPYVRRQLTKKERTVSLPIDRNSSPGDIRLVQGRLGITDDGVWGPVTTSAVAALADRSNTGDPGGHEGRRVNGRMYNRLAIEFLSRHVGGGGDGHHHDGRYLKDVNLTTIK